ncbi:hypothetical protein BTZ20_3967 [Rhodococcus sp. MTM3W5.2]|nr:hypothetical protein BTZ20_3967 [Rhodococcus sp. MTM3W5.2]
MIGRRLVAGSMSRLSDERWIRYGNRFSVRCDASAEMIAKALIAGLYPIAPLRARTARR